MIVYAYVYTTSDCSLNCNKMTSMRKAEGISEQPLKNLCIIQIPMKYNASEEYPMWKWVRILSP
jgi:hypothetical protein